MMLRSLLTGCCCLLLVFSGTHLRGQVVLQESFDGAMVPAGWASQATPANQPWIFSNPQNRPIYGPGFNGGFALLDSDAYGGGNTQNAWLISPRLDVTSLPDVGLSFFESFRAYPASSHALLVSTDDGMSWTTARSGSQDLGYPGPAVRSFVDLSPWALGADSLRIAFRYQGTYGWWWALDSIRLGTAAAVDDYPMVNVNRPRIAIDSQRFDWISANYTTPAVATFYNAFVAGYTANYIGPPTFYLGGNDSTLWNFQFTTIANIRDLAPTVEMTAFIWRITADPIAAARLRHVAQRFVSAMQTADFAVMAFYEKEDVCRYWGDAASHILDWCRSVLPLPLRDSLALSLYRLNRTFMDDFILNANGNSYVSSHNALNTIYAHQTCLALYYESAIGVARQDTVTAWFRTLHDKWRYGFFPAYSYFRDDDGGWNWGAAYSFWSLFDQYQLADNYLAGTNYNVYHQYPLFRNGINQYWYLRRPDKVNIHYGDGETKVYMSRDILRHAAVFADSMSQWIVQNHTVSVSTYDAYQVCAYRDFILPPVAHPQPPKDWWSDKTGLATSITDWTPDAVQFFFYNGLVKKSAHEHFDNNTFTLYYKKPLLLHSGYYDTYGGSHYLNYYSRSVASNTLCVYDSTEQITWGGTPVANDGGQRNLAALQNHYQFEDSAYQTGSWDTWAATADYTFIASDASTAFSSGKVKKHLRRALFLKPNRLLILDNIVLTDPNPQGSGKEIRFTLHPNGEPQFSEAPTISPVFGHIEEYLSDSCTVLIDSTILRISSLYPPNNTFRKIGGSGYEYFVDGNNFPPQASPCLNCTAGEWRIEILPSLENDSIAMVSEIHFSSPQLQVNSPTIASTDSNSLGVRYPNELYLFSREGGIVSHLAGWMTSSPQAQVMGFGLITNTNYCFYVNGNSVAQAQTDAHGIISQTLTIADDSAYIEIAPCIVGQQQQPLAAADWQYYPNPAHSEVFVTLQATDLKQLTLELCDVLGRPLQQTPIAPSTLDHQTVKFSVEHLPQGIYFLLLRQKGSVIKAGKLLLVKDR